LIFREFFFVLRGACRPAKTHPSALAKAVRTEYFSTKQQSRNPPPKRLCGARAGAAAAGGSMVLGRIRQDESAESFLLLLTANFTAKYMKKF
jgi:hypothetical protein